MGVSTPFLRNFQRNADGTIGDWVEAILGRAAILRLEGTHGSVDIVTVYMPTGGARKERDGIRDRLLRFLRPPSSTLTILIGDWNFVTARTDRLGLTDA